MRRYLDWNRTEQICPAIASSPPPIAKNPFSFALNCFNSGSQAGNSLVPGETSSLFSAVAAVTRNPGSFVDVPSPLQLQPNDQFLNLNSNFTPENQFTTSAPPSNQPQLSAAAAEYILAAAFASNTSQLACPTTPLQQSLTPSNQPPTPQQNQSTGNNSSKFFQLNQFGDQNSAVQNLQRQNATAALVAAIQQRQNQEELSNNRSVDIFAAAQSGIVTDNNVGSSIVAQLSSPSISTGGDSPLTNKLAGVCAAALAASTGVTSGETNGASTSSTQNACSSSQIILNAVANNCTSIDPTCTGPSSSASSSSSNPSSVAAFLNQQHTSAFQLVPPPQQTVLSSFLQQQQQLHKQSSPEQVSDSFFLIYRPTLFNLCFLHLK